MSEITKEVIDEDPMKDFFIGMLSVLDEILIANNRIVELLFDSKLEKEANYGSKVQKNIIVPKEIKSATDKIFDYYIKTETDKAILVYSNLRDLVAWIPRKAIKIMTDASITLNDWFKSKVKWQEDKTWD